MDIRYVPRLQGIPLLDGQARPDLAGRNANHSVARWHIFRDNQTRSPGIIPPITLAPVPMLTSSYE